MAEFLFQRAAKLILAAPIAEDFATVSAQVTEITDLRLQFKIVKTLSKEPNTAEISIYNLSASSRGALPDKGAKVILHAGYQDTISQIFFGDATFIESRQEGPDWITKLQSGDGQRGFSHGRVSESFAGGVPAKDVIAKIGAAIGIDTGNLEAAISGEGGQYVNGYAVHGKASKELDRALKSLGYEWSIQDGALQVVKEGEATTEEIVELSPDSGLIGSPEMGSAEQKKGKKKPILKAKSLLQPSLKPGAKVKITSGQYNGTFKLLKVEHSGDTAGGDWYSSIEAEAI